MREERAYSFLFKDPRVEDKGQVVVEIERFCVLNNVFTKMIL